MELLIGCGASREKVFKPQNPWTELLTLDVNPAHKPNVVWDLEELPYPFEENAFDEIHAYEVLEHIGQQGDYMTFFAQFSEFWRILKPGGKLCATVPPHDSAWAWGDPSHKRIINAATLTFLCQSEYEKQVGKTSMSDFRYLYKADFKVLHMQTDMDRFAFVLEAVK